MSDRGRNALRVSIALITSVLTIAGWLAQSAPAQSGRRLPSSSPRESDDTIRLRAEEVLLNVTVTDSSGRQITSLKRDDFIIAEDNERQDITSFLVSSVPVNVVLMLDASGSVAGEIDSIKKAAMRFVAGLGAEDQISLIKFHTDVELIQDWTSKADDVRHAVSWRFKPGMVMDRNGSYAPGSTSLYDALYATAEDQLAKVEGRKAIILLTDGDDTSSKLTYEKALSAVVKSGAVVFVISKARAIMKAINDQYGGTVGKVFGTANAARTFSARLERAELMMTNLSRRTGGQIFSPLEDKQMESVYGEVARELKNQYIITYVSKNGERDGRLRQVRVYLARPGYQARTREAYYAPKE